MSTISDKLLYLDGTRAKIKENLNKFGSNITENDTFRSYANKISDIYDKLPKVEKTTSSDTLLQAQNGLLDEFKMYGNTKQGKLPDGYTQVDYIESTGTQYIDTNFKPNGDTRTVCNLELTGLTTVNQAFFGARISGNSKNYSVVCGGTNHDTFYNGYNTVATNSNTLVAINTKYKIDKDKGNLYVNDVLLVERNTVTFEPDMNMMLFCTNQNGTNTFYAKMKLYNCEVYDNGVLIRKYIPCYRNNDNEVGLFDIVNGVFYTNQGTGAFTYSSLAPTPDAPINIDVVTGEQTIKVNGKNLFNKDNANVFTGYISGSNLTINTSGSNRSLYIECKPNTTYTIQKSIISENRFRVGTSNTVPTTSRTLEDAISADSSGSITLTTSANAHYLIVHFYNTASENTIEQALATIQIEKGNLATDWEAYQEQNFNINLHGKNLFDKDHANLLTAYINTTNYKIISNANSKTLYIPCKPNTTYTISRTKIGKRFFAGTSNTTPNIDTVLSNVTPTGQSNEDATITITTDANANYLCVFYSNTNNNNNYTEEELRASIQIEEGSTATNFEAYYNYELCKIDTYEDVIFKNNQLSSYYDNTLDEDSWYIKKEINKVVLNGSEEDWSTAYRTYTLDNYINAKVLSSVASEQGAISDYFKWGNGSTSTYIYGSFWYASGKNLRFQKDETLNLSNFKTWLSTHNTEVYYILATPTTTEITQTELINQLEAISVFTGINNFSVSNDNNVLPSLNVKRLKELDKLS